MSFIQFESATEKEKIRQELRDAREELLNKAKKNAEDRAKFETERKLRGDDQWMLPSLAEKIERQSITVKKEAKSKKKSKEKKTKKEKKKKKKHRRSQSPSKVKKHKKKSKQRNSSENNSSSEDPDSDGTDQDEWVEKKTDSSEKSEENLKRDDWMTSSFLLPTFSKNVEAKEKDKQHIDSYDPGKSSRELNPYWKDGGTGLPAFRKPKDEDDDDNVKRSSHSSSYKRQPTGNWRKKTEAPKKEQEHSSRSRYRRSKDKSSSESSPDNSPERSKKPEVIDDEPTGTNTGDFLTDQQMNELGAKLVKAEIMGNDDAAKALKDKLEKARKIRQQIKDTSQATPATQLAKGADEHILLTTTDSKGATRPLVGRSSQPADPYSKKRDKRKKVETHEDGKRVKYFPDDDRYDIKQMFEREKYATASESDAQFAEIAGRNKSKDDLDDIFADKVRKEISEQDRDEHERKRAIWEHQRLEKTLETCERCFDSPKMEKQLLVSMGSTSYLALPWHEALQPGHCTIAPIQHVSCATQLDEDTWSEVNDFRKALVRMFAERGQEVIFFEIARYLNRRPHMVIHCIPSKNFEMAPFYFKKAIQESEHMWSTNKQLISLRDRDLRRAIPKGLPYFWVHFGMESGFAHVIEDQERFPANFAQEIIGGMLELDQRAWRKPRKEQNSIQKVKQFADMWKPFDCTN